MTYAGTPARLVRRLLRAHHPHREELRAAAVCVAQRLASTVDLVLAGGAADLEGRLAEAEHAGGADRVRGEDAARAVDRELAVHRGRAGLRELPAAAVGFREAEGLQPH